jgi:hypothetical protein
MGCCMPKINCELFSCQKIICEECYPVRKIRESLLRKSIHCEEFIIGRSDEYYAEPSKKFRHGYVIASNNIKQARDYFYKIEEYEKRMTGYYNDPFDLNVRFVVPANTPCTFIFDNLASTFSVICRPEDHVDPLKNIIIIDSTSMTALYQPFFAKDLIRPIPYKLPNISNMRVFICWL